MSEKIAIYTCIFGEFDKLRPILNYKEDGKYVFYCLTDNANMQCIEYKKIVLPKKFKSNRKNCRYFKVFIPSFLKNYSKVIYHDGNLQLDQKKIPDLLQTHEKNTLGIFRHEKRQCAYDEILACLLYRKEKQLKLLIYAIRLWLKKYPANNGLYESGILIRNTEHYSKSGVDLSWWHELNKFTLRDQVSLCYVLKNRKYSVSVIPGNIFKNEFTSLHKHTNTDKPSSKITFYDRVIYKLILMLKSSKRVK